MSAIANGASEPPPAKGGAAPSSDEHAISCPRCGGSLEKRSFGGGGSANPFLSKKPVMRVVCVDCGLDGDAMDRHGSDPW